MPCRCSTSWAMAPKN